MNVMQYLIQQTDEFRDSYQQIDSRVSQILDKLEVLEIRLQEIEFRINNNQNDSDNQYNKVQICNCLKVMKRLVKIICMFFGHDDDPPIVEVWESNTGIQKSIYLCRRCLKYIGEKPYV